MSRYARNADYYSKERWQLVSEAKPATPVAYENDRNITGQILGPDGKPISKFSDKPYVKLGFEVPDALS